MTEHRYRYQKEQPERLAKSLKLFKKFSGSLDEFCVKYNKFLQNDIFASHNYLSPKIEDNYRRNYYQGEASKITPLVFYLYYKTCAIKKLISRMLISAYRKH